MSDPVMPVGKYCEALRTWARIVISQPHPPIKEREFYDLQLQISKSCLLKRLIYMGEELRTRKCPIHRGKWSGCFGGCAAECNGCGCECGWIPNDAPVSESFGWTFWLACALGEKVAGLLPPKMYSDLFARTGSAFRE